MFQSISPIKVEELNTMKVFVGALFALAAAEEKKVPPRHPSQRLKKLLAFAEEWCDDNLSKKEVFRDNGEFHLKFFDEIKK